MSVINTSCGIIRAQCLFCESVRQELSGQVTVVGVYDNVLQIVQTGENAPIDITISLTVFTTLKIPIDAEGIIAFRISDNNGKFSQSYNIPIPTRKKEDNQANTKTHRVIISCPISVYDGQNIQVFAANEGQEVLLNEMRVVFTK